MLDRPAARIRPISIVPLVDVLLILLVFFMVTSTYLDLDTVPVSEAPAEALSESPSAAASPAATLLVRIGADGSLAAAGRTLTADDFAALLAARIADEPDLNLVVLPSPRADVQALVTVMDRATLAGATRLRVLRLAEP